ncbi:MAG: tetrathionate reductase family octaheme c-type cytochrome [Xanthomonadales bacterium]|nr:tetrathionate reductase family octaheme c-type cytochrome [Xanthomonadales bacterium]
MFNNDLSQSHPTRSRAAPLSIAAVIAFCVLLCPMTGLAQVKSGANFERASLATKDAFLEYASVHDENIHELYFGTILYEGTESCLMCHEEEARMALDMGHFKWQGTTDRIAGLEGEVHGKNDLLNNFCIAVPTNEGRCTQCHIGYGYADAGYDFNDPKNVDCLVCHDQSGTYKKGPTTAGMPDPSVDLNLVARSISLGSKPTRKNCIGCHANAGGGDNVKHGDLSTDLLATTREYDVHMGTDGANFDCVDCHAANHDPKTGEVNHGNAGMSLHSVNEGEMRQCTDCHGGLTVVHADTPAGVMFEDGWHEKLACQVCHIPAIARAIPTKVEWYWADAGQDITPPIDPETGQPTYDKKKGSFVWKNNVRPTLRYSNGNWKRMIIGVNDTYDEEPIQLAVPLGDHADPEAMIYPFKMMVGNQPVDPNTHTVLVPHLFGKLSGPNPYWAKYDWKLALQDGANYTGQNFSGTYAFGATEMLLSVNHEVAPAEHALGYMDEGGGCKDCHNSDAIDWPALGWTGDPTNGGSRESTATTKVPDLKSAE